MSENRHDNSKLSLIKLSPRGLFQLTKPSIMLLVLISGMVSIFIEGSLINQPRELIYLMLGLFLTGGCANSLNQYLERRIDARMSRTMARRPLPSGKISARQALFFSLFIGISGILLLGIRFNWATAALALSIILFYGFFYTLWLKPRTPQNIVIGGLAGALVPVGTWMAVTETMSATPWLIALIIFLWTPPHFWCLAIYYREDYRRAGLPMMPLVRGEQGTLRMISIYVGLLFIASLVPIAVGFGVVYALTALTMGTIYLMKTHDTRKKASSNKIRSLFRYSIIYLLTVFFAMIIDGFFKLRII